MSGHPASLGDTLGETIVACAMLRDGTRVWACGAGQVVFQTPNDAETVVTAHAGALLVAAPAPDGLGMISGGDDGRLVLSRPDGTTQVLLDRPGRWIEPLAVSDVSGLVACGTGKEVLTLDMSEPHAVNVLTHATTALGLAFHPKGRRLAVAHKDGASLWYARGTGQTPIALMWAGAHMGVTWAPDGRFVITSMHDNMLHGWKVDDKTDMRMAGYPHRISSMAWLDAGRWLATAGAPGAVLWPFDGKSGPMGRAATEVGFAEQGHVTCVCAVTGTTFAAGTSDGRVWVADLASQHLHLLHSGAARITALAATPSQVIWGDQTGQIGTCDLIAVHA